MSDLRYPLGELTVPETITDAIRQTWIAELEAAPALVRAAVAGLTDEQLDTPYRPGGWTVRQVVHHLPDSHVNAYVRFRLALTEEAPVAKTYEENRWVELPDAKGAPLEVSLVLLEALHRRWVLLLQQLTPADWERSYTTTEGVTNSLNKALALYSWHGRHHAAHITSLRQRMGW